MNSIDRSRRRLAIAAAALAGYVDATGFLSANRYFVSFMSGNTTRLGVDLIASPATAFIPALLILGFVFGVFGGAILAARAGRQRKFAVLLLVASLLALTALAASARQIEMALACMVLAMGALNNTFQRNGEVTVGLTYMTGALVKLGMGLARRIAGHRDSGWLSWAQLWAGLLAGAVLGAYLQDSLPLGCLWIASAWSTVMVAIAFRFPAEG